MQHRNERRGLGGIFFDDLNDYDQEMLLGFATGKIPFVDDQTKAIVFK
jgi:coproporphyrinogen III oxidase